MKKSSLKTPLMDEANNPPNVLIFPFPAQGHVNSMLKLAELLALSGIHITFLVTQNIQDRLLHHTTVLSRFSKYPGFYLETLPGEIGKEDYSDDPDVEVVKLYDSLNFFGKPYLRQLLAPEKMCNTTTKIPPITSIIADGILNFALDVAQEIGVPFINFRTISACAFWAYFSIPQLIETGELPFSGINQIKSNLLLSLIISIHNHRLFVCVCIYIFSNVGEDMDKKVANVKGMEEFLRRRDLPSMFRATDLRNPFFQMVLTETLQTPRARGLILNTFENLEEPILSLIRSNCNPNLYTIGPLHTHLKARLSSTTTSVSSNSLREEDRNCIRWLGMQPPKSVIYVSFGSVATVTRDDLLEFWHGLVNSGTRFLWVMRPDLVVAGKDGGRRKAEEEVELEEATAERGYMVEWAPQEEVLGHEAVGGFLTHSGWNSTLESIAAGVPMICWSYFADQQINSRFVGEVWKMGLDMKDTCNRDIVEQMVRDIMVVRKDELLGRAEEMAELAKNAISDGGSSFSNLDRLVEDIRQMSMKLEIF